MNASKNIHAARDLNPDGYYTRWPELKASLDKFMGTEELLTPAVEHELIDRVLALEEAVAQHRAYINGIRHFLSVPPMPEICQSAGSPQNECQPGMASNPQPAEAAPLAS